MESEKKLILVSSDSQKIEVSIKAIKRSKLISGIIDDYPESSEIPIKNVNMETLKKLIEYLEYYKDKEPDEIAKPLISDNFKDCVNEWDYNFINVDLELLFSLISAANYLDIKCLLELSIAKAASMIQRKNPEEIWDKFNLPNFTADEEKEISQNNEYALNSIFG